VWLGFAYPESCVAYANSNGNCHGNGVWLTNSQSNSHGNGDTNIDRHIITDAVRRKM
jgi:hypothetical protein